MSKYTITLEVETDSEGLNEAIEYDLGTVRDGKLVGNASAAPEEVVENAVESVTLAESNLPTPVAIAINEFINNEIRNS